MRKAIIALTLSLIFMAILAACGGGSSKQPEKEEQQINSTPVQSETTAVSPATSIEQTQMSTESASSQLSSTTTSQEVDTPPLGGGVKADDYDYESDISDDGSDIEQSLPQSTFTVDGKKYIGYRTKVMDLAVISTQETDVIGGDISKSQASGKFLQVGITIGNGSKDAITVNYDQFKLIDPEGNEYSMSLDSEMALDDSGQPVFNTLELNPKMSYVGFLAFDVPKEIDAFKLKVSDYWNKSGDIIPLEVQVSAQ